MTHHPHVHMIVPGGGLSADGIKWISCRPNFFLPVRVLSRLFRRLFLAMLVGAHEADRLKFFGEHAALADKGVRGSWRRCAKIEWVVYAKEPFGGPEQVLRYLSRYTHRVAISNRRLVSADDTGVTFKCKDYRIDGPDRYKTMTLHAREFIRRFLMHVLPKGFHRIRHYGLSRQWQSRRQHRARAASCSPWRRATRNRGREGRQDRSPLRAAASLSVLRRAHAHHRDLRRRL